MKLPKSKDTTDIKYNNNLIIIDKLTKYIYFIFCREIFEMK